MGGVPEKKDVREKLPVDAEAAAGLVADDATGFVFDISSRAVS